MYFNLALTLTKQIMKVFTRVQQRETQSEDEAVMAERDAKEAVALLDRPEIMEVFQKAAVK